MKRLVSAVWPSVILEERNADQTLFSRRSVQVKQVYKEIWCCLYLERFLLIHQNVMKSDFREPSEPQRVKNRKSWPEPMRADRERESLVKAVNRFSGSSLFFSALPTSSSLARTFSTALANSFSNTHWNTQRRVQLDTDKPDPEVFKQAKEFWWTASALGLCSATQTHTDTQLQVFVCVWGSRACSHRWCWWHQNNVIIIGLDTKPGAEEEQADIEIQVTETSPTTYQHDEQLHADVTSL